MRLGSLLPLLSTAALLGGCGVGGASGPTGSTGPTGPAALRCAGSAPSLPAHLAVGYAGALPASGSGGFDLRYQYLAGVLAPDPACLAPGRAKAEGCGTEWWGTWQWDQEPPGRFVSDFASATAAAGLRPMFTYYLLFPAAQRRLGISEGTPEVTVAARDRAFMTAYLDDFRFFLRQLGSAPAIVHVEPDFWGYAQHAAQAAGVDAHGLPAAVASANPTDCAAAEDSIAGLGRCMISMVRTYAPDALVSLHGSAWASGFDCVSNRSASSTWRRRRARPPTSCSRPVRTAPTSSWWTSPTGTPAGTSASRPPRDSWLDATDAALPTFTQAFTWSRALAERAGKKVLWWQLPVGNMSLANTCGAWQDNKLDYFFDHPDRVAASGAAGMAFGSGATCQTDPDSDGGHLRARAAALARTGGQPLGP